MKCPNCQVMLVSAERNDVEIDYCPSCWGIWLDKGELNEIVKRSVETQSAPPAAHGPMGSPSWAALRDSLESAAVR